MQQSLFRAEKKTEHSGLIAILEPVSYCLTTIYLFLPVYICRYVFIGISRNGIFSSFSCIMLLIRRSLGRDMCWLHQKQRNISHCNLEAKRPTGSKTEPVFTSRLHCRYDIFRVIRIAFFPQTWHIYYCRNILYLNPYILPVIYRLLTCCVANCITAFQHAFSLVI